MRIYIIRHAEPDYENNTITPSGHLEAQALSKRLSIEKIDKIFSSPLGRAIHTMQYTAEIMKIEPVIESWLAELKWGATFSSRNKLAVWNVGGEVIRGRESSSSISIDNWHTRFPFNSPKFHHKFGEVIESSDRFLSRHGYQREGGKYRIVEPNRDKIAVFCHMGFGLAWVAHLLALPLPLVWAGFWLAPSSVTTILLDERSSQWAVPRCTGLSDVSHLHANGLPVSRMGIVANSE